MEPHINYGQPGWLGAWLQDRCHEGLGVPEAVQRRDIRREERDTQRSDSASLVCPIAAGRIRLLWVEICRMPTVQGSSR
jgi:hypothetical protein